MSHLYKLRYAKNVLPVCTKTRHLLFCDYCVFFVYFILIKYLIYIVLKYFLINIILLKDWFYGNRGSLESKRYFGCGERKDIFIYI